MSGLIKKAARQTIPLIRPYNHLHYSIITQNLWKKTNIKSVSSYICAALTASREIRGLSGLVLHRSVTVGLITLVKKPKTDFRSGFCFNTGSWENENIVIHSSSTHSSFNHAIVEQKYSKYCQNSKAMSQIQIFYKLLRVRLYNLA